MLAELDRSVLAVVDMQPNFLAGIVDSDRVLARTKFMVRCAHLLGVPIFVTEQYPSRMGHTEASLLELLAEATVEGKMVFSAWPAISTWLPRGRDHVVLCGIETPICVNQTAQQITAIDFRAFVVEDAVGARSEAMHANGIERMRRAGCHIAHSESIVYEWMRTADHPAFRDVLKVVKEG